MVNRKIPTLCPSCESHLNVQRLSCSNCGTQVDGQFSLPLLSYLNKAEQEFLLDFVKCSGSLKEMASQRSLSYPSVRNQLDDLITRILELEKINIP
jgi:hypothetical protein